MKPRPTAFFPGLVVAIGVIAHLLVFAPRVSATVSIEPAHMVTVGAGIPIPLRVLGYSPSLKGSQARYELLFDANTAYHHCPFTDQALNGSLYWGIRASVAYIQIAGAQIQMKGVIPRIGPEVLLRYSFGTQKQWAFSLAAAPVFAITRFEVDSRIQGNLPSLGIESNLWIGHRIHSRLHLGLNSSFEYLFRPFTSPTLFNHQLGPSIWLTAILSLRTDF